MSKSVQITNETQGVTLLENGRWCDSFLTKLRGFQFTPTLTENDGLVLVEKRDSRVTTSIHMLFVKFDLGVIWVNDAGRVVDKIIAKPWALSYAPKSPARYTIELHPKQLERVEIDDLIYFEPV